MLEVISEVADLAAGLIARVPVPSPRRRGAHDHVLCTPDELMGEDNARDTE